MKKIVICTLIILMAFTSNVYANSKDKTEDEMINEISMVSGMSTNEVEQVIKEKSFELSIEYEELVKITYDEYVLTASFNNGNVTTYSDTGTGGWEYMNKVNLNPVAGDYFYTPSIFPSGSTVGWDHGHSGLYISRMAFIHAPGQGDVVSMKYTKDMKVQYNAKFARLKSSNSNAVTKAVNFVQLQKSNGAGYNLSFDNKMCDRGSFNCSQLVYCAYKQSNILLNNGSAMFVSPQDLVNDSKSNVYKTYTK